MTQEEIDQLNKASLLRQRTRRDASDFLKQSKDDYQDIIRRANNTKDKRLAREKLRELESQASEALRLARQRKVNFSDAQAELNRREKDRENTGIDETGGGTNATPKPALGGAAAGVLEGFEEETLDIVNNDNTAGQRVFLTKAV
jgi:hypothetical protein